MPSEREFATFHEEQRVYSSERLGLESHSYESLGRKGSSSVSGFSRFLGRNWLLLLLPALTFGGAATYLILKTPEMYRGEFQLLVEPVTSPNLVLPQQPESSPDPPKVDYGTLTRLLASPDVLTAALPDIEAKGEKINLTDLQNQLQVMRVGKAQEDDGEQDATKLISVQFEDRQPRRIEVVLGELAKRFVQYGNDERRKSLGGGVEFIEKQIPEVRQRVTALESQLQKLEQQYRISDLDSEGAALATRSRELESQRQQIQAALKAQQQLRSNLEQQLKLTPTQVVAASQVSENPNIQAFAQKLQEVEAQLSITSSRLAAGHPELVALEEQRQNLESALRKETQKVLGASFQSSESPASSSPLVTQPQSDLQKSLGQQLIATINETQVLNIQNQALNQAASAIDEELRRFPGVKRQHKDLQAKLEVDRQLLNKLLDERQEFRVKMAHKEIPWQVVKQPTLLKDAQGNLVSTAQKGWYKIGLATLGGLLLGLGAALLKEKRQDIFYSVSDLKDSVPLNLLGMMPLDQELKSIARSQRAIPSESDEEVLYQFGYPQRFLQVAENIYANLRYLVSEQSNHALVISSVMPEDGKTLLAINLAKAVAGMGQRVLLVDANLSVPQLHARFGLPNFQGLSDILAKEIDPNELIQRSPMHGSLFLLTAGQMSRKASKLLASNQMAYLMEQLQNMFDLVIYDTTSLQGSSGANFLALNAQGLILTVGIKSTRRSVLLKTLERLRSSRIPIRGMVANFVREPIALAENQDQDEIRTRHLEEELEEDEFEIFRVE